MASRDLYKNRVTDIQQTIFLGRSATRKLLCYCWVRLLTAMTPCVMMTSSNGIIFRVTGPFQGNSPVTGEFPSQRPVTWSFDVFFALRLNKRLSKQFRRRWFETPSRPLWRHCNVMPYRIIVVPLYVSIVSSPGPGLCSPPGVHKSIRAIRWVHVLL